MKLLDAIAERMGYTRPQNSVPLQTVVRGSSLWDEWGLSSAGLPIPTEQTARTVSVVTACVNLISGAISSIPLDVHRRARDGRATSCSTTRCGGC
jgi:hypothetical protein